MESLTIIFNIISCLLGILVIAILLLVNQEKSHSNRMLVLTLMALLLLNLNGFLFNSGWFLQYPSFHKIIAPISLLVAPAAYLYVRSVLQGEIKYRKYDWLLLIPTLFSAINLIPYYAMPAGEKKIYLIQYYINPSLRTGEGEGFLPAYIFSFLRFAWSVIFILLNSRLIRNFKKQANKKLLIDNAALLNWLTVLNVLLTMLLAAALFVAIVAPIKGTGFNVIGFSLGTIVLVICIELFIRPKILYGIYQPSVSAPEQQDVLLPKEKAEPELMITTHNENKVVNDDKSSILTITPADSQRYKRTIENFFHEHQPFLDTDYSLESLVADVKIPRYILSAFINREYGMGFREFLNRYRVDYLKANLHKPEWKQFTIEAIATECGFSSRVTFSNNFKQITGQTPSEFIKNQAR